MRKITFFVLVLGIFVLYPSLVSAQFTPEEVAERAMWEEFIKTAKVVKSEQPWKPDEAVTKPWRLYLEKDGKKLEVIWKDATGGRGKYRENWKWEIAAYRMDKLLGLNMICPTVERRFREDRGSCQMLVYGRMNLEEKESQKIKVPPVKTLGWNRSAYLQRFFDNLIGNEDRHQKNFRITEDWRMILIDHSRSFRSSGKYAKRLIYDEKHAEGPKLMREIPRELFEKIKALNHQMIKEAVGEYLTDKEIECVLIRRDLIVKWLNKRIEKMGEDSVLY